MVGSAGGLDVVMLLCGGWGLGAERGSWKASKLLKRANSIGRTTQRLLGLNETVWISLERLGEKGC